jgi:hypothetical protein
VRRWLPKSDAGYHDLEHGINPMPQTSTIAFALIIGFIVFITVRGELPTYLGVIGLGNKSVAPAAPSGTGQSLTSAVIGAATTAVLGG